MCIMLKPKANLSALYGPVNLTSRLVIQAKAPSRRQDAHAVHTFSVKHHHVILCPQDTKSTEVVNDLSYFNSSRYKTNYKNIALTIKYNFSYLMTISHRRGVPNNRCWTTEQLACELDNTKAKTRYVQAVQHPYPHSVFYLFIEFPQEKSLKTIEAAPTTKLLSIKSSDEFHFPWGTSRCVPHESRHRVCIKRKMGRDASPRRELGTVAKSQPDDRY